MNILADLTLSTMLREMRDTRNAAYEKESQIRAKAIEYIRVSNLTRPVIRDSLLDAGYTQTTAETESTWFLQFIRKPHVLRKLQDREITVHQARKEIQSRPKQPLVEFAEIENKPNPTYFIKQMNQFLASAAKVGHKFVSFREFIDAAEEAWDQTV